MDPCWPGCAAAADSHARADAPGGSSGQKAAVCLVGGRVAAHAVGGGAGGVLCDVGQGHGAVRIPPTNVVPHTVARQPAGHTLTALLQMGAHGVDIRPQLDAHALGVHLQDAECDLVSRQQGEVLGVSFFSMIILHFRADVGTGLIVVLGVRHRLSPSAHSPAVHGSSLGAGDARPLRSVCPQSLAPPHRTGVRSPAHDADDVVGVEAPCVGVGGHPASS